MKNWNKLYLFIIATLSIIGTLKILELVKSFRTGDYNYKIINSSDSKLKSCFDLENKNKRRIDESLELIEYCVKEFGIN